jgi:hypothetical protein
MSQHIYPPPPPPLDNQLTPLVGLLFNYEENRTWLARKDGHNIALIAPLSHSIQVLGTGHPCTSHSLLS